MRTQMSLANITRRQGPRIRSEGFGNWWYLSIQYAVSLAKEQIDCGKHEKQVVVLRGAFNLPCFAPLLFTPYTL